MKVSDITAEYVAEYLNEDMEDIDVIEKIQGHLDAAKNMLMKLNDFESIDEMNEDEYLADLVLNYIQQMHDAGKVIFNKSMMWAMTMDRRY